MRRAQSPLVLYYLLLNTSPLPSFLSKRFELLQSCSSFASHVGTAYSQLIKSFKYLILYRLRTHILGNIFDIFTGANANKSNTVTSRCSTQRGQKSRALSSFYDLYTCSYKLTHRRSARLWKTILPSHYNNMLYYNLMSSRGEV